MTTYVLVHGGLHGGWCWKRPAALLRDRGHDVYAPTLTGMGERLHLLTLGVGLSTHIEDIVGLLEWEDLSDVVLVGHSYGGMPITGVAERAPERISSLIYLDALFPQDGEAAVDILQAEMAKVVREVVETEGEGWRFPVPKGYTAATFGVTDPEDARWVNSKLSPMPAAAMFEPLGSTARARRLPGAYITCSRAMSIDPAVVRRAGERAARDSSFRLATIDSGHDAMISAPEELATLLVSLSA
jgi:pimeloyl-ACP methyl ester carboxylesterase